MNRALMRDLSPPANIHSSLSSPSQNTTPFPLPHLEPQHLPQALLRPALAPQDARGARLVLEERVVAGQLLYSVVVVVGG